LTEPERGDEPRSLDDWLRQFFRDSSLIPVLLVAVGCFTAIGGGVIAWAAVERNPAAIAALLLLIGMTLHAVVQELRRTRRLGLVSRCILGLWALSALAAAAAVGLGLA
jgi:hypothetical protein